MITNFKHRYSDSIEDTLNTGILTQGGDLTSDEQLHLEQIKTAWNFYEGYHWEGIDDLDKPQVTFNYCRPFVNKFVSFEFGKGFTIKTNRSIESIPITVGDIKLVSSSDEDKNGFIQYPEGATGKAPVSYQREKTEEEFLEEVWADNNKEEFLTVFGQTKSITGDAWTQIKYESPEDLNDPFEEYPQGRIRLTVIPTQYVFPRFNDHDKDKLESLLIMYPIHKRTETSILARRTVENVVLYKELWTNDTITTYEGSIVTDTMQNPYGFIPFVQTKNFPIAGRTRGASDIDDLIPLNVELNTKKSDVSEIIDYHSAPITLVYGAKIGNLEKGANKVWGGLPKDSKVENLALNGDLVASTNYIHEIKTAMCEIGGIPESALGGASAVSNTSGVAFQYINLPLIERTRVKRNSSKVGIEHINKMILFIALKEGLIVKPDNITMKDFVSNTVDIPETLPKDELIELQKIHQEMLLGLECRHGALERLGADNISAKLEEVDVERDQHPELFNPSLQADWYSGTHQSPTNAGGMLNGQTPIEQVRKEITGKNGGGQA